MDEANLQNQILQARDRELNAQNARFDAALNNMSQALCMVDATQRLIVCNTPFLELFGLSVGVVRPGTQMADVFRAIAAIGRYDHSLDRMPSATARRRLYLRINPVACCRKSRMARRSRSPTSR